MNLSRWNGIALGSKPYVRGESAEPSYKPGDKVPGVDRVACERRRKIEAMMRERELKTLFDDYL